MSGSELKHTSFSEGLCRIECPKGHTSTPERGSELAQRCVNQEWKTLKISEGDCVVCKIKLYRFSVEKNNGERKSIYGWVSPNVVNQYWQAYAEDPEVARVIIEKVDPSELPAL